jgi:biopolymer transport protein ExbD
MGRFNKLKRNIEDETELNMVPIMNLFMVLIPFLLMSASFYSIKAINTSVPIHADKPVEQESAKKHSEDKITVVVELKKAEIRISALSYTISTNELATLEKTMVRAAHREIYLSEISKHLEIIKEKYPASDTMILIPDGAVLYEDIIQAMDCARKTQARELFPNVVLSGSLG